MNIYRFTKKYQFAINKATYLFFENTSYIKILSKTDFCQKTKT